MQFQKYKNTLFAFSKMAKKSIFAPEKSPKIAFLVVLNFFLVQELIFCHFWKCKKCVFVLLKLHCFPNFRALWITIFKIYLVILWWWCWFFIIHGDGLYVIWKTTLSLSVRKCSKHMIFQKIVVWKTEILVWNEAGLNF